MPRHNFAPHVGGWKLALSENGRAEIKHRWPGVPLEAVNDRLGWYVLRRDAARSAPPPNEVAEDLRGFLEQVRALRMAVERLQHTAQGAAISQNAAVLPGAGPDLMGELLNSLAVASAVVPGVLEILPSGRPQSPRDWLALELAALVREAELEVNAKPNGPLCGLLAVLLQEAGEPQASAVGIAKRVLANNKSI